LALLAALIVIAAAVVVPLALRSSNSNSTRHHNTLAKEPPRPMCTSAGCAVVQTVLTSPRTIVFYGASCSATRGPWFLNVTEGGSTNEGHLSFALEWTFTGDSTTASPSGEVAAMGTASKTTVSLSQGVMNIVGTTASGTRVNATGTIEVALTGTSSAPQLQVTETGLSSAESALNLVSPLDLSGAPTVVPVKLVQHMAGC
jgi:hypothetical protein